MKFTAFTKPDLRVAIYEISKQLEHFTNMV